MAWITPNDAPGAALCRPVFIPAGLDYEAAFRGAFLLLCDSDNWEVSGAQTPEDVAAAFFAAFSQTLDGWSICVGGKLIGEIFAFGSTTAPDGALPCDGALYDPAIYPDLFAVIGTNFGGNGTSTFAVPDLRGRMPIGSGAGPGLSNRAIGSMGGEQGHQLTINEIPAHSHTVKRQATTGATPTLTNAVSATFTEFPTSEAGGGGFHENMSPFTVIGFFIQAE